ncbi:hypothetical protein [Leucobacter aridicollis]|uniref:hypothetical protein n=1 Tax=Leucobacter aridicollis TaxID=283878 RepID=UPI000E64AE09|nr:hypothetical protein [Leucobacter aridicollis]UTX52255.1 hypothetical protein KI794_10870 [Leucobacter aridicollis]
MNMKRVFGLMLVAGVLSLTGCSSLTAASQKEPKVDTKLTWQEAKAATQEMEREIAELIPKDVIVNVYQVDTGTLMSCGDGADSWFGGMTVTVAKGTDIEAIVRDIETHYESTEYATSNRLSLNGHYKIAVKDPETTIRIIVGEGLEPTHIDIDSASECFVLPEGVYRGGDF